jgi:hypothetical protein
MPRMFENVVRGFSLVRHDPQRVALQNLEVKNFGDSRDRPGSNARAKLNSLSAGKEIIRECSKKKSHPGQRFNR